MLFFVDFHHSRLFNVFGLCERILSTTVYLATWWFVISTVGGTWTGFGQSRVIWEGCGHIKSHLRQLFIMVAIFILSPKSKRWLLLSFSASCTLILRLSSSPLVLALYQFMPRWSSISPFLALCLFISVSISWAWQEQPDWTYFYQFQTCWCFYVLL